MYDEFSGRTVMDLGCGTVGSWQIPIRCDVLNTYIFLEHAANTAQVVTRFNPQGVDDMLGLKSSYLHQAMLAIGAAMLGAAHVLAVDCDEGALQTAAENCGAFDGLPVSMTTQRLCETCSKTPILCSTAEGWAPGMSSRMQASQF